MDTPIVQPRFYTENKPTIKWLPSSMKLTEHWNNHQLLLPASYPASKIDARKILTASMWSAYSKCQRNFALTYMSGLERRGGYLPLHVGTFSHDLFTSLLLGDLVDIDGRCQQWIDRMNETRNSALSSYYPAELSWDTSDVEEQAITVASMARRWRDRWGDQLEPLAVSIKGRVPLRSSSGRRSRLWDYGFEFDGIVRDRQHGDIWVWEFKTTALSTRTAYETYIEHSPQAWGYSWAAGEIFRKPVGMIYDVIRKKQYKPLKLSCCQRKECKAVRAERYPGKNAGFFTIGQDSDFIKAKSPAQIGIVNVGKDNCESCGGCGFVGISTSAYSVRLSTLTMAMKLLSGNYGCARRSPAALAQFSKTDFETFCKRVEFENSNMEYRIWRRPTREYIEAFESESYNVAIEIGRKIKKNKVHLSGGASPQDLAAIAGPQWLSMRGSCVDFTGRACSFRPICPSINGSGFSLFSTRDASVPVELAESKESHDTGIISF